MTELQYLQQNLLGFEGDTFARDKFKSIIDDYGIEVVVETGTYLGSTTRHLASWCKEVHTIEVNEKNYLQASKNLRDSPARLWLGNSAQVLDKVLALVKGKPMFIFLDAHWESYNPLPEELRVIARHGLKPIIAIHDFKVPGHPELGFDSYKGQDYDFEWIRGGVVGIYGENGYTVEYNSEATGARRGIIYIYPR